MVETNNKEGHDLSFKPIRLNKVTTVSHLYIFYSFWWRFLYDSKAENEFTVVPLFGIYVTLKFSYRFSRRLLERYRILNKILFEKSNIKYFFVYIWIEFSILKYSLLFILSTHPKFLVQVPFATSLEKAFWLKSTRGLSVLLL